MMPESPARFFVVLYLHMLNVWVPNGRQENLGFNVDFTGLADEHRIGPQPHFHAFFMRCNLVGSAVSLRSF